jgi:beta-lactamase regulating signal transducer with metallopeptidase domain
MIGTIVAAALWALVASLLLSVVLGAAVAGLIAFTRPAAATRQALWSVALAAAGFAPVAILAVMLVRGAGAATDMAPSPGRPIHVTVTSGSHHAGVPATAVAAPQHALDLRVPGPPDLTPIVAGSIVVIWALGALIGLAGLGRSLARVRGLKGRSSPLDGTLATELPWLTTTAGREIYLRLSYETETPIAVGFRRPVILLPTEMATADGLTSIEPLIMHEYAHLARYDDWSNLAQRATERLFWFNPLVWILGSRIALEREVAADEAVIARTHDPKVYATTLWRMAQEMRMPEHVVVAPGAMLTRKQISVRIERLLDEHPASRRHAGAAAFAIVILTATGVAGLAATAPPIVLAQRNVPLEAMDEPNDAASPAATVSPLVLRTVEQWVAPVPPVVPKALPKPATTPAAKFVADADDTETLGQHIQADIQSKIGDALTRHGGVAITDAGTAGTATRELIRHCIGCDFSNRDLRGIDLSNISLVGDDFSRAKLNGANFSHAALQGVDFKRADLGHVNFRAAKLTGVDLRYANLDYADLSNASLTGVDLGHATIDHANTTGMQLLGSSLP